MKSSSSFILPPFLRCVAAILIPVHILTAIPMPLRAEEPQVTAANKAMDAAHPKVETPKNVKVKKGERQKIHKPQLDLSVAPDDIEIQSARVFLEPLVPMSGAVVEGENRALARTLKDFKSRTNPDDLSVLKNFLVQFPGSRWKASLNLNLGLLSYERGYLSQALSYWQSAWDEAKNEVKPEQKAVAERAVGELLLLNARVGRTGEIEKYLSELGSRNVQGSVAEQVDAAKQGLDRMKNTPGIAFKCGPFAVNSIANLGRKVMSRSPLIEKAHSTIKGTNLLQVKGWAKDSGLKYQTARRSPGAAIIYPAVMHWKLDHFAALLKEKEGKYLVQDATFGGGEIWISANVLDSETDGYFLVPAGNLPSGWISVGDAEAEKVWGKGGAAAASQDKGDSCPKGTCKGLGSTDLPSSFGGHAMAQATYFTMQGTLNIRDTPLFYSPPVGPEMEFGLNYNHLETGQPATFTFPNFGPNWSLNWLSYLTVDASKNLTVNAPGGGVEVFKYSLIDNITNAYAPHLTSQAVMVLISSGVYHRKLSDGSIQVFNQADGTGRIFMTEVIDPQGNSAFINYDANFRITTILDVLNQPTTFTYKSNTIGNIGYYKIARITDPFGRYASFDYDTTTTNLVKITDMIGIESAFTYDTGTFIDSLSTPYGKSQFFAYVGSGADNMRGLKLTAPDGGKQVVESWLDHTMNTYYWGERATMHYPADPANKVYTHCEITHWLLDPAGNVMSPVMQWTKKSMEEQVNYSYPDQSILDDPEDEDPYAHYYIGISNKPSEVKRVLDGGTTFQIYKALHNDFGKPVQTTDPEGRQITLAYAANNVDLLEVRQTKGGDNDLLGKWIYNDKHRPLTYIDASGQKTLYTYNARGQVLTVTNAKNQVTTLNYDSNGYLTSIDGPLSGSNDVTTLTYDGFGRVDSVTDSKGYTVEYDYDALNRLTLVTYPDSTSPSTTYQQIVWNKLDTVFQRDRTGKWTSSQYNSVRRLTQQTDPLGRTTKYDWCSCGALDALVDAAGNRTEWHRDDMGRVTSKKFADTKEITYTYESSISRLKTMTDALAQVTTYTYNKDNSLAGVAYSNTVHSTSNVSYTYDDEYPRPETISNGWGTYTYSYNANITDPLATAVTGAGQLHTIAADVTSNSTIDSTIEYSYDELGRVVERSIDGSSNETNWTYDDMGRITNVTNPLGSFDYAYVDPTYGVTRLASVTNPNGQVTNYSWYNNAGDQRLQTISNVNSSSAVLSEFGYTYDAEGMITQWTQQAGAGTVQRYDMGYDAANQLTEAVLKNNSTNAVLKQYLFGYDTAGNRSTQQVDGLPIGYTNNNVNQLTEYKVGGQMEVKGSVNEASNVNINGSPAQMTSGTTFKGKVPITSGDNTFTVTATDGSSNVKTDTFRVGVQADSLVGYWKFNEGTGTTTADSAGNSHTGTLTNGPTWTTRPGGGNALLLDGSNDLVIPAGQSGGAFDFGTGSFTLSVWFKTSSTDYKRMISKGHNGWTNGYLFSVGHGSPGKVGFGIGGGGVAADATLAVTSDTYNDGLWHHAVAVYDSSAKRQKLYIDGVQKGLNKVSSTGGTVSGLELDTTALTNLNASNSGVDLGIGSYNPGGENFDGSLDEVRIYNRALSASEIQDLDLSDSPRTITYDDNGNMLTNGTGQTYEWDAANRMTKISYAGSGSTEFTYDAMGRRVKIVEKNSGGTTTSTKQFVWCGMEICEERNVSYTVVTRFFAQGEQVPAASSPDNKLFYTKDHLGSIRELVDNNQVVRGRWDYDPYGKRSANLITSGALETNFSYTGHYAHATSGLVLAPYRAYDANLGRWLSRDPITENGGINLYQYVLNRPTSLIDRNGFEPSAVDSMASGMGVNMSSYQGNIPVEALPQIGNRADNAHPNAQDIVAYQSAALVGVAAFVAPPAIAAAPALAQGATVCLNSGALNATNALMGYAMLNPKAAMDVTSVLLSSAFQLASGGKMAPSVPRTPEGAAVKLALTALSGIFK